VLIGRCSELQITAADMHSARSRTAASNLCAIAEHVHAAAATAAFASQTAFLLLLLLLSSC
jgi:hypothetical protein